LTGKIRGMTAGRVVGVDPAEEMIRQAQINSVGLDIEYEIKRADQLNFTKEFDVIFCNSAFQWFNDPVLAVKKCHKALRHGGRVGIQAPARAVYSPNFISAVVEVASDSNTREAFATFRSPWFFLESADNYKRLFTDAEFDVPFATIAEEKSLHPPDDILTIFKSGAAAGYLNPDCYGVTIDQGYCAAFLSIIQNAFIRQARDDGLVELVFNRIYLVGVRS